MREFARPLLFDLKVRFQDERLTTRSATRALIEGHMRREKRKEVVDMLAATLILQTFLDAGGWPGGKHGNSQKEGLHHERGQGIQHGAGRHRGADRRRRQGSQL